MEGVTEKNFRQVWSYLWNKREDHTQFSPKWNRIDCLMIQVMLEYKRDFNKDDYTVDDANCLQAVLKRNEENDWSYTGLKLQ